MQNFKIAPFLLPLSYKIEKLQQILRWLKSCWNKVEKKLLWSKKFDFALSSNDLKNLCTLCTNMFSSFGITKKGEIKLKITTNKFFVAIYIKV